MRTLVPAEVPAEVPGEAPHPDSWLLPRAGPVMSLEWLWLELSRRDLRWGAGRIGSRTFARRPHLCILGPRAASESGPAAQESRASSAGGRVPSMLHYKDATATPWLSSHLTVLLSA